MQTDPGTDGGTTYELVVCLPALGPADAIEGHIWGSVLPCGSEGGLGHLGELQVLRSRNDVCSQKQTRSLLKQAEVRLEVRKKLNLAGFYLFFHLNKGL